MKTRLADLSAHSDRLIDRAAEQRAQWLQGVERWHKPAELLKQGTVAVAYLKAHPLLVPTLTAAIGAAWPRRAGKWMSRGWLAWRLYRSLVGPGRQSEANLSRD